MSHDKKLLLGIEIGGSKVQIVAAESAGRILQRQRFTVGSHADAATIRESLVKGLRSWKEAAWSAAGVGFGGPVDRKAGRTLCSHQIAGWDGMDLCDWVSSEIKAPTAIENDSNLAALAEAFYGAGTGRSPVFYTNSGSGVGGGLVVEGKIYHGAHPGEAEFGHVLLAPSGPTVEQCCSGWAVDRKVREHCARTPSGILARLVTQTPGCEARHLKQALIDGDASAKEILSETAGKLAFALSHVVHLFHPSTLILGGGLSLIGEPWRVAVAEALPRHLMGSFSPGPEVHLAALGEDVVPHGALMLAESLVVSTVPG
jgi:glucokinase